MFDPFIDQLVQLCQDNPTRSKWVIVPTHALGHTIGDRLVLEGTHWANLRFKTPFDLALELAGPGLAERGIDPAADDSGPAVIMRLLRELPDEVPAYFRHLALHPQMGSALWATVRELRLAGIASSALSPDGFENADKHAELVALLAAFEAHLASRRLADRATVYREALQHLEDSAIGTEDPVLRMPDVIWAPLVQQLLDGLPGQCIEPIAPRIPGSRHPRRFAEVPARERAVSSPLAYLLSPTEISEPASPDQLQLFRAGGREAEVEEVFRRILHGDKGSLSFDHVEIACSSPDYVPLIWQKAQRYEWPITFAPGLPVTVARPARALLAWCDWIEEGFPASGLRRLFQSGDVRLEIPDGPKAGRAARLLLRAEATWGRQTYASRLTALAATERTLAADPEVETDEAVHRLERAVHAEQVRDWITALLAAIPEASTTAPVSLLDVVTAAHAFIDRFATTSMEMDRQAKHAVKVALDELRTLGQVSQPTRECLQLIRASLEGVTVAPDRARPGHLHVTMLHRAGFAGRTHTFVVGLQEGRVFPHPVEDPVLLDAERETIHPSLATSLDRVEESVHTVVSRMAVLGAGGAASRSGLAVSSWTLSYSCRDLRDYRETFPSWLMLQARRLRDPQREITYEQLGRDLGEPVSMVPRTGEAALSDAGWWLSGLQKVGNAGLESLFVAYPMLARGLKAEHERASTRFTAFDGFVPAAAAQLDPRQSGRPISASKLEGLAACPFRYFLQVGLRLRPLDDEDRDPDEWLDPLIRGGELHALYADVMRRIRQLSDTGEPVDPRRQTAWLRQRALARLEILRSERPPPSDAIFERDRDQLLRDIELFLAYEAVNRADGREPVGFEVGFGLSHGTSDTAEPLSRAEPVELALGARRFRIRGRIDRIDRIGPGHYEVTDYKTGSFFRPAYTGTFNGGRLLQHALYGIAAADLLRAHDGSAVVGTGTYYFPSQQGGGQQKRIPHPSQATLAQVFTDLLDIPGAGAYLHTADEEDCRFCELSAACGGRRKKGTGPDIKKAPAARAHAGTKLKAASADGVNDALKPFLRMREHD